MRGTRRRFLTGSWRAGWRGGLHLVPRASSRSGRFVAQVRGLRPWVAGMEMVSPHGQSPWTWPPHLVLRLAQGGRPALARSRSDIAPLAKLVGFVANCNGCPASVNFPPRCGHGVRTEHSCGYSAGASSSSFASLRSSSRTRLSNSGTRRCEATMRLPSSASPAGAPR